MKSNTLNIENKGNLCYITFPKLSATNTVRHIFSTRMGGVSGGQYSSMNLSFNNGDERQNVEENYRILCSAVGIDTENLVLTVPAGHSNEFGDFLKFEALTLFPYDKNLIDLNMLSAEEKAQINDYHAQVRARLTPHLNDEEQAWLNARTEAI